METEKNQNEDELRIVAKKRAKFKRSLLVYFVVSAFFWVIWYLSGGTYDFQERVNMGKIPWPVWAMAGWGLGLVFQYIGAYHSSHDLEEREYQKLKNKNL